MDEDKEKSKPVVVEWIGTKRDETDLGKVIMAATLMQGQPMSYAVTRAYFLWIENRAQVGAYEACALCILFTTLIFLLTNPGGELTVRNVLPGVIASVLVQAGVARFLARQSRKFLLEQLNADKGK